VAKLTLTDITTSFGLQNVQALNNAAIEAFAETCLTRDGLAPNFMQANIDMNGFTVTNLKKPVNNTDAARYLDVLAVIAAGLPDQTGHAGHFLGTNGTVVSWLVPAASLISVVPVGALIATDVQGALAELDSDLTAHITATPGAHVASAISNTPAGNIAATDVQGAVNELDTEKAPRGVLTINDVGGTRVLTAAEFNNAAFDAVATLTSDLVIQVPDGIPQIIIVDNGTSGSFSVTVKHAATAGVVVSQGFRFILYTNGSIIEPVAATGGGGIWMGTTAPTDTTAYPFWLDTSGTTLRLYTWDGVSAWFDIVSAAAVQAIPENSVSNDLMTILGANFTTASTTAVQTGLAVTLAARDAANGVELTLAAQVSNTTGNYVFLQVRRDGAFLGDKSTRVVNFPAGSQGKSMSINFTDYPGDTASHVYEVWMYVAAGTGTLTATGGGGSVLSAREKVIVASPVLPGPQPVNLAGLGSDYQLAVGQIGYIDFSATASVPLNVAVSDGEEYEICFDQTAGTPGINASYLHANNTSSWGAANDAKWAGVIDTGAAALGSSAAFTSLYFGNGMLHNVKLMVRIRTVNKALFGKVHYDNATNKILWDIYSHLSDTTTAWVSLGTLAFGYASTGRVTVRRII